MGEGGRSGTSGLHPAAVRSQDNFLGGTIGQIHHGGNKGVCGDECMTSLFVKFGKQKNNKYFK